jgi:hypothetical protein
MRIGCVVLTTLPTSLPTSLPTTLPTQLPTTLPTSLPTTLPTSLPTSLPTTLPTQLPTTPPTLENRHPSLTNHTRHHPFSARVHIATHSALPFVQNSAAFQTHPYAQ